MRLTAIPTYSKFANAFFAGPSVLLEIALVLVKPVKTAKQASAASLTKVIPGEVVGAVLLFRAVRYCQGDLLTRAKDERAVGFAGWADAIATERWGGTQIIRPAPFKGLKHGCGE